MTRTISGVAGMLGAILLGIALLAQAPGESKKKAEGPPGREGRKGPPGGEGRPGGARSQNSPPVAKDDAEKKILDVLNEVDKNRRGNMNVPLEDGRLLRLLAESVGAKQVVEIGTSTGYSGIWICMALRKTGGKLVTHEIDAGRAAIARENFKKAGVDGLVTLVEGDAHKEISKVQEPIDLLFIDAEKEGYPDYLKQLLPKVRPGGLILAHNMTMRGGGVQQYYEAVTSDPTLETILSMEGGGMSITMKKR